mmetsp:Transcript_15522/g.42880  ORF Transcript_15522/g.42880 Transcript_15522/m.42880 type:complete len:236 (+) Transcript_15522:2262-2969(+)
MLSPSSVGPRDSVSHSDDAREVRSPHSEDATELGMCILVLRRSRRAATLRSTSLCRDLKRWNCASISSYSCCSWRLSVPVGSACCASGRDAPLPSSNKGTVYWLGLKGTSIASSSSPAMEKICGGRRPVGWPAGGGTPPGGGVAAPPPGGAALAAGLWSSGAGGRLPAAGPAELGEAALAGGFTGAWAAATAFAAAAALAATAAAPDGETMAAGACWSSIGALGCSAAVPAAPVP